MDSGGLRMARGGSKLCLPHVQKLVEIALLWVHGGHSYQNSDRHILWDLLAPGVAEPASGVFVRRVSGG